MIRVILKTRDKDIVGFKVSGHAEYDEYGKDIVCAGISMLVYNTIDTITDILLLEDYIDYSISENSIRLDLVKELNSDKKRDFKLIMKKFELGVKSSIQSYRDYVELNYMEV